MQTNICDRVIRKNQTFIDIEGLVFVLAMDKVQLVHSVKGVSMELILEAFRCIQDGLLQITYLLTRVT